MASLDTSQVHALAADIQANASQVRPQVTTVMARTSQAVVSTAQVNAPVDTGNLAGSISADVRPLAFEAGPDAEYGGYVEEGTDGPYLIENAFGWGIAVEHPGIAPQPYLGPAFDRHEKQAYRAFERIGDKAIS